MDLLAGRLLGDKREAGGAEGGHRRRLWVQQQLTSLDLRQIEDVGDQGEQVAAGLLDALDTMLLLRGKRVVWVVEQELGATEDRGERRAQLVAHYGQELVLQPPGVGELEVRLMERHRAFGNALLKALV